MSGMGSIKNFIINNFNREFGSQDTNRGAHMAHLLCVEIWLFI
jgi:hypothetical protein